MFGARSWGQISLSPPPPSPTVKRRIGALTTMVASEGAPDDFNHQLAIKLSRAMNIMNPNDLLAHRVRDIAKTNTMEGFIVGE